MSKRQIQCPKCQSVIRAPSEAARVKCPRCQTVLNLPARAPAAQPHTAPAFTPTFPPSAARPAAATSPAGNEQPAKSKHWALAAAIGGGVLILCLLVAGMVVALLAMRGSTPAATEPLAASDEPNPAAATPVPLPPQWQSADVLGASATFPLGAIERSKDVSSGTQRVVSAETSAKYELRVEINSPPDDDPRQAIELAVASRVDGQLRWTEIQRGGHSGYRAVLERGEPPVAVYLAEAYPLPSGRVILSYQAFSHQSPSKRPDREEQQDAPSLDLADAFMASLTLPAELPATTDSMSIQTRGKLREAEKKQLYALYKVAFDQAHQKIRIPRGYARAQTEKLLDGILASEVQKLAAMFDVSEEEVASIAAEGRALAW